MVDAPAIMPLHDCVTITARGPFSLADELALMSEHHVNLLVTKNSGGDATFAKIAAARALSIPVVMVDRPEIALYPGSETVDSVDRAVDWVAENLRAQILRNPRTGDSSATSGDRA